MNSGEKGLLLVGATVAGLYVAQEVLMASSSDFGLGPTGPFDDCVPPVDALAPHEPATSFDPTPKPGTKMFRQWAISRWGQRAGSPENIGRWDKTDKPSEHHEGRAWDQMLDSLDQGQHIWDELLDSDAELARRAGIMYIIFNKKMWRSYPWLGQPAGSIQPYTGSNPHTDHLHYSFSWAGANGETSLYKLIGANV